MYRKIVAASILAAALVGLTACGSPTAVAEKPTPFKVTGSMTVEAGDGSDGTMGGECVTDGGYSDISVGTQVTVKDAAGKVLALGSLGAGRTTDNKQAMGAWNEQTSSFESVVKASTCTFYFSVENVLEGESIYSIEVAHRGELRYNRADLGTSLALNLG